MMAFESLPHHDPETSESAQTHAAPRPATTSDVIAPAAGYVLGLLRIAIGWYFLWAFLDKTFGLGYSTPSEGAWIDGGSPTTGYLSAVEGPFGSLFNDLAGQTWVDWLFMIGLLGIGVALILGIGMWIAAGSAAVLLLLMYAASLPLETNPIIDDHVTQAITVVALAMLGAGRYLGLGRAWQRLTVVREHPWLT